jgi:lysophospholipase L1-like esterase
VVLLIFLVFIYQKYRKHEFYYLALGDSIAKGQTPYGEIDKSYSDYVANYLKEEGVLKFYTNDFAESGQTIKNLILNIENNQKIIINNTPIYLKDALRHANLITLSIGANDFFKKVLNYEHDYNSKEKIYVIIDEIKYNLIEVINKIKNYSNATIILVGYYNPFPNSIQIYSYNLEPIFDYANETMKEVAEETDVYFLNIYEVFRENTLYLPNPEDVHPSLEGYNKIGELLINLIQTEIIEK